MMEGILIYEEESSRYQVRYGLEEYSSGLHCGECLSVLNAQGVWQETRIEFSCEADRWYLVSLRSNIALDGLRVRYERRKDIWKMNKHYFEKSNAPKEPLSKTMQIAKIAFVVLVVTQAVPILFLGMGSINQIAIALFPESKAVALPVLVTCEALVLVGMVACTVYRMKK